MRVVAQDRSSSLTARNARRAFGHVLRVNLENARRRDMCPSSVVDVGERRALLRRTDPRRGASCSQQSPLDRVPCIGSHDQTTSRFLPEPPDQRGPSDRSTWPANQRAKSGSGDRNGCPGQLGLIRTLRSSAEIELARISRPMVLEPRKNSTCRPLILAARPVPDPQACDQSCEQGRPCVLIGSTQRFAS